MDKMKQKPVEERRKLLILSTALLGGLVLIVGLWNISNNIVAMGRSNNDLAQTQNSDSAGSATSIMDKLRTQAASVWGSVSGGLNDINNKLGPAAPEQTQ
ncbi:MAG: hypothetical protein HY226_05680 [Candidatus Vogelbacteria bacterium]|nr:hypothetical protein [Candidatus Vogelbacteria bacterium]